MVKKVVDRLIGGIEQAGDLVDAVQNLADKANPTETAKANYTATGIGNDKGSIRFGHIHEPGDVTSGVLLQTPDGKHNMTMDIDGQRKGFTTFMGPGNFQVECGDKAEKNKQTGKYESTMMLNAKKGDIHIIATDGKIRLEADSIDIIARGEGGSEGNITCTATENFVIKDTKKVLMDASIQFKITTSGDAFIAANSMLGIYGAVIKGVTDACSKKPSKNSNQNLQKRFTQGA